VLSEEASAQERFVHDQFRALVLSSAHPCLGAHTALRRNRHRFKLYDRLASPCSAAMLRDDLLAFSRERRRWGGDYSTFVASFRAPQPRDEAEFESLLWRELQLIHDRDSLSSPWDDSVSHDPAAPGFSYSVGGEAFFVVGLHANASRFARRFAWPTLCFNPHDQFEHIRAAGHFTRMRDQVRARDLALQGSRNPMGVDFGSRSEASQYSGRLVEEGWSCPLRVRFHE
jgi:uncharacterized protein